MSVLLGRIGPITSPLRASAVRSLVVPISTGTILRCFSQTSKKLSPPNSDSIYVISIPITTHKSYVYCNHKPHILGAKSTQDFPLLTRLESKATEAAAKAWKKISTSKATVNVKITQFFNKVLDTVAYEENCLRSFPSKSAMIREINEDYLKEHEDEVMIQHQIDKNAISQKQIKPIPLIHAGFQHPRTILDQLNELQTTRYAAHLRYTILCGIGVPISLPFAIVPVIPNIPGFYLAYRFYCNLKALNGINHLKYLLEPKSPSSTNTKHLKFVTNDSLAEIYLISNTKEDLYIDSVQEEERIIISSAIIDELTKQFHLPQLQEELNRALRQETARLKRNIKVDDAVE